MGCKAMTAGWLAARHGCNGQGYGLQSAEMAANMAVSGMDTGLDAGYWMMIDDDQ